MGESELAGATPPERRRHPRYALDAKGTAWMLSGPAASPFPIRTSNISQGGMMLHTAAGVAGELEVGNRILLAFPAPAGVGNGTLLRYKAGVTWKRRGLANLLGSWAFGVCFLEAQEEDIQALLGPASSSGQPLPEN